MMAIGRRPAALPGDRGRGSEPISQAIPVTLRQPRDHDFLCLSNVYNASSWMKSWLHVIFASHQRSSFNLISETFLPPDLAHDAERADRSSHSLYRRLVFKSTVYGMTFARFTTKSRGPTLAVELARGMSGGGHVRIPPGPPLGRYGQDSKFSAERTRVSG